MTLALWLTVCAGFLALAAADALDVVGWLVEGPVLCPPPAEEPLADVINLRKGDE